MTIQRVSSKWSKTKAILLNRKLSSFIPDTRKLDWHTLQEMVALYGTVYIKPDRGTYGSGVMKVEQHQTVHQEAAEEEAEASVQTAEEKEPADIYMLRYGKKSESFSTLQQLHKAVAAKVGKKLYLIQKGIHLLTYNNLPFDLRVLTQKTPSGAWETTGMVGRVAAPMKVVTNYHNGGTVNTVPVLLKEHMDAATVAHTMRRLSTLGIRIAAQLERTYPDLKEIGLDVAIDDRHDLWVLEVNTLPAIMIFKTYFPKQVHEKIYKYATAYGRFSKKTKARRSQGKRS